MQDRADPHARERAFDIARRDPPIGVSAGAAEAAVRDVLDSIGDTCPECPQRGGPALSIHANSSPTQRPYRFPTRLRALPTFLTAFFTAGADFRSSPPRTVLRSPDRLPPAPGPAFVRAPSCSSLPPSVPPVVTLKQRDRDSQVPERFELCVEFFQWRFSVTNRWRPTARPTSRSCKTSSRANRRASSS
jgi:hypothetical protein